MEQPKKSQSGPERPATPKFGLNSIFSFLGHVFLYSVVGFMCLLGAFFVLTLFGFTQGSIASALWRATGCVVTDSQEHLEHRSAGYLPNRCGKWLSERATKTFVRMNEPVICEEPHTNFVCRLLIFDTGLKGPVRCYRAETRQNGSGLLTYKTLDCEPNVFSRIETKIEKETLVTHQIPMSSEELTEFTKTLAEAREYYMQNRFHSYECTPSREHYLLEFEYSGRYYYYDFEGRAELGRHAMPTKPLPPFLQKLVQLCQEMSAGHRTP